MIKIRQPFIGRPSSISPEQRAALIERYNNSTHSYRSLAKELGIPYYKIRYVIQEARREYEMSYMCAEGEE